MTINKAAEEVIKLAKAKGFPHQMKDMDFLLRRIEDETKEAKIELGRLNYNNLRKELTDTLIQVIQALAVIDTDVEGAFKETMKKNWKREWK